MITEPASRLLLLAIEAVQREAAIRVSDIVNASAESESRSPGQWQFDFAAKQWIKLEQSQ